MEIISNESSREQVFKCEWNDCERVFDCKSWLLRHQKNVHNTQKPFSCNMFGCEKRFSFNFQLKNHHLLAHQKGFNTIRISFQFSTFQYFLFYFSSNESNI
jgi:hypothetical protein